MNPRVWILAGGGLLVLVVLFLASRRGNSIVTIGGNVGPSIGLPGLGNLSALAAEKTSPVAAAAVTTPSTAIPAAIANRYGSTYRTP